MATGTSNTFVLTTASTALSTSRTHINGSLQSLAQNFYSSVPPAASNFTDDGAAQVAFTDSRTYGLLYYDAGRKALYVNSDTADKKGAEGPGGNFTRVGIGSRYEDNIIGATANIGSYQIGELVAVFGSTAASSTPSNIRLMIKGANSASNFTDVGIPPTNGVTSTMLVDNAVTTAKVTDRNISNVKITAASISIHELDNFVETALTPTGVISGYGGSSAPSGYLLCDGAAIARTGVNANLFSTVGTAFGTGNGNNTFNVPDLRDRMLLGKGSNNSTLGAQTPQMPGSATKPSESTSIAAHSLTTATFATSAKDSSQSTAVTAVADHAAITPNMIFPTSVVNFIIKL
tara:strand:+ start:3715 stop:4755 length:1041 start_codon:yes stop_codon:yes gene_type:complete